MHWIEVVYWAELARHRSRVALQVLRCLGRLVAGEPAAKNYGQAPYSYTEPGHKILLCQVGCEVCVSICTPITELQSSNPKPWKTGVKTNTGCYISSDDINRG